MYYLDLLNKPFAWAGRGPDAYDCYGLCQEIYRRIGRELPDYDSSDQTQVIALTLAGGIESWLEQIPQPEPFCLVTFRIVPPFVTHLGVVMDDCQTFLHILQQSMVTRERLSSLQWSRKIAGYYRLRTL